MRRLLAPRVSPETNVTKQKNLSTAQLSRRRRWLTIFTVVLAVTTVIVLSITSTDCIYIANGKLCYRPGQVLSFWSTTEQWLYTLQPDFTPYSDLKAGGHAHSTQEGGRADQSIAPLESTAVRKNLKRFHEELYEKLSRSWRSIADDAKREDAALRQAERGQQKTQSLTGVGVPFYLRYLAALHTDADPDGNHFESAAVDAAQQPHEALRQRRVQVRFVTVANMINPNLCALEASAALRGVPLYVLGLDEVYGHFSRYETIKRFIEREGLHDDDVLVIIDGDTVWTGEDVVSLVEKFIRLSPSSEDKLEVSLTRAWEDYGEFLAPIFAEKELLERDTLTEEARASRPLRSLLQMAPIVYNAEHSCFLGNSFQSESKCSVGYSIMEAAVAGARNRETTYSLTLREGEQMPDWFAAEMSSVSVSDHSGPFAARLRNSGATTFHLEPRESVYQALDAHSLVGTGETGKEKPIRPDAATRQPPRDARDDPFLYHRSGRDGHSRARFMNMGSMISRLWAFKKLLSAQEPYTSTHIPSVWQAEAVVQRQAPAEFAKFKALGNRQQLLSHVQTVRQQFLSTQPPAAKRKSLFPHWTCDQSAFGTLYLLSRVWEAEHGLLERKVSLLAPAGKAQERPGASGASSPALYMPYGLPAGLSSVDRRSEFFFVTTDTVNGVDYDHLPDQGSRICGGKCSAKDSNKRYHYRYTTTGAPLTAPLFYIPVTEEDVLRHLYTLPGSDSRRANVVIGERVQGSKSVSNVFTTWKELYNKVPGSGRDSIESESIYIARPALIHFAGGWKQRRYAEFRRRFPWFVVARSGNRSDVMASRAVLNNHSVEAWSRAGIYHLPYTPLCGDPFYVF